MENIQRISTLHEAFVEGLKDLGNLHGLNISGPPDIGDCCQEQFGLLFKYATRRMGLAGRDRDLPAAMLEVNGLPAEAADWVKDTDKKHTITSFDYLVEICCEEDYDMGAMKRACSAMIVHDCAYPRTTSFEDFTSTQSRSRHMINGAEAFRNYALLINDNYPDSYSRQEIEDISAIIEIHDNPGIGIPFEPDNPQLKLLLSHREADRLWMVDNAGFALDLARRLGEEDPWYDPAKYLAHVVSVHMKERSAYDDDLGFLEYLGRPTLYTTKAGFAIFKREVDARMREYEISENEISNFIEESN